MPRINLLPWREEKRRELQTEFLMILGFVALLAASVCGVVHFYYVQLIDKKNFGIAYIEENITVIDKKIGEIKRLEKDKEGLLSRMRAIEQLQGNRPLIVRFFDELITSLPEGITIKSINQKGTKITVNGLAQSNSRVSSFMRKIESSDWLSNPDLKVIQESSDGGNNSVNNFILTFAQVIPRVEESDS